MLSQGYAKHAKHIFSSVVFFESEAYFHIWPLLCNHAVLPNAISRLW